MIKSLRQEEEILLYENIINIGETEAVETIEFLKSEYERESLEYLPGAPAFQPEAALWAAKTTYITAQLILYRETKEAELDLLLPPFDGTITSAAILSADLCLRFIPDMLTQLNLINAEDKLIAILEEQLDLWHYSGIRYPLQIERLDFKSISSDSYLKQLYSNRIIEYKRIQLAKHPAFKEHIAASLGIFSEEFWNNFKLEIS